MHLGRRVGPLLVAVLAGCGGGGSDSGERDKLPRPSSPGAAVVDSRGCLSCHRIGRAGRKDPGSDLTRVGLKRSAAQLERSLLDPPAGMPSFGYLPSKERENLVAYMKRLR